MPKINVYLPDDLAEAVKEAELPVSAVCQRALEQAVRRVTAVREIAAGGSQSDLVGGTAIVPFTARTMRILKAAQAEAEAAGLQALDSAHLLRAIVADRDAMAVRVLATLDITSRQLGAELDRRVAAGQHASAASGGAPAALSPDVAKALELATNEASALGTSYLGTEHLLLGMIGEPDGVAGHALRALGADLRLTRRTVAAALAGYDAGVERRRGTGPAATGQAAEITAVIRSELAPVLVRIERLEAQLAR